MGGLKKSLAPHWKNIILRFLMKGNSYCSFAFKRKWRKALHSRKKSSVVFRCSGQCTFKDCPVKFTAEISDYDITSPPSHLNIRVSFSSSIVNHDRKERKARQIQEVDRKKLRKVLTYQSPSTVYSTIFASIKAEELESGKRDKVGKNLSTIQKISSEANKEREFHFELIQSLINLRDNIIETSPASKISGYIQRICAYPFSLICFTEEGVRLYHHLIPSQTLFLDATGSIMSLNNTAYETTSPLYYYSLVIKHPIQGEPPVAVAEFISTEHSVLAVSHFLESFRRSEALIYGYANVVMPHTVVIDRSLTLLLSFLKVYNQETLSDYLHRCFRLLMGCSTENDFKKTFIHACISHVMKSIRQDLKRKW